MILPDVNILVYAHREDSARHSEYLAWLNQILASDVTFGLSDLVLSGFLRVVTHPRVFGDPTPLDLALQFAAHCALILTRSSWHQENDIGISFAAFARM